MAAKIEVNISPEIASAAPGFQALVIEADITDGPTDESLKKIIERLVQSTRELFPETSEINKRPGISGTREAYKSCGKDPNRYRPSQEQLTRRIVSGKDLYYVSNVVDVFNYLSVFSGYSIGAFDIDKIEGTQVTLGIGRKDEPYEGIGRGVLNIEGLPVYRDSVGGIGTPTSDNERTKITLDSHHLLVCINIYRLDLPIEDTLNMACALLREYCKADNINARLVSATNKSTNLPIPRL